MRFNFHHERHSARLKVPLSRYVKIRQANSKKADRRPVVVLPVQVGGLVKEVEFTLKIAPACFIRYCWAGNSHE
ncbi:RimK/LysX family protein [Oceanimonas sp. NS1]|nr:RimK/LysX family protein [Oceanimonas sp. NS1]